MRCGLLGIFAAIVCVVGGCSGDADPDLDDQVEQDSAELSAASGFDRPIRSHFADDVVLATPSARLPILDRDGKPLGPMLHAYRPNGAIRIQGNEAVKGGLYWMWGDGDVESGFVKRSWLSRTPDIPEDHGGNGEPAPSNCRTYVVHPTAIPTDLRFERHDGKAPSTLATYGTPGAPAFAGYTFMTWNVVDVDGGGLVRSVLREGERFYASKVKRVTIPSVASPGAVTFMYGFAFQNGQRVYGWTVVNHVAGGQKTNHVELVPGAACQ